MHLFEVQIALTRCGRQASDVMTHETAARQLIGRERECGTIAVAATAGAAAAERARLSLTAVLPATRPVNIDGPRKVPSIRPCR